MLQGIREYTRAKLVSDVVETMKQISPDRKVVLVGHDWGAFGTYMRLFVPEMGYRTCEAHVVVAESIDAPVKSTRIVIHPASISWCMRSQVGHLKLWLI